MDNPFKKRATEYVPEARELLPLISPAPVDTFFAGDETNLLDKLAVVVGTPGSGKTTIAKVIEFESLDAISRDPKRINRELADTLTRLGLLQDGSPTLLAYRLQMTSNFRSIWDLPYEDDVKRALLRSFVQSKSMLGWFRALEGSGISADDIDIKLNDDVEHDPSISSSPGASAYRARARDVEAGILKVVTALIPPDVETLAADYIHHRYDIFEAIQHIEIRHEASRSRVRLKPMIIVDDAHELHPGQFAQLKDWLMQRNIKVSRWIMCRADVVPPEDFRGMFTDGTALPKKYQSGTSSGRDYIMKVMELLKGDKRSQFSNTAKDISKRYISAIPIFSRRQITTLSTMLDESNPGISQSDYSTLNNEVLKLASQSKFSEKLMQTLKARINDDVPDDVALAALRILIHREINKTPQLSFLEDDREIEQPHGEDKPVKSALLDGAKIQLLHQFRKPYYYGFNKIIEAANFNIEQFIKLSDILVDNMIAIIIKGKKNRSLTAKMQHEALTELCTATLKEWDFPFHVYTRKLVQHIASRCEEITLRPNAPLDAGANAIGVAQSSMDTALESSDRLSRVLHFAFANNALNYIPNYSCKGKTWCLLELGAIPCIAHGLTLRRGGFVEGTLSELEKSITE